VTRAPRSLATCGPSFETIVGHFAPESHVVTSWVEELRELYRESGRELDAPLELGRLLEFGYEVGTPTGEEGEPFESLEAFVESAHQWGLTQWLTHAAALVPVAERVAAAIELTTTWWLPVLRAHDAASAAALERLVLRAHDCARDPNASRGDLETALSTGVGLPPARPPPPYVGHFRGAVSRLLQALTRPPELAALAESLSYAAVAPDGSRRSPAIAAVVEGT
jgi:hypothetical protein